MPKKRKKYKTKTKNKKGGWFKNLRQRQKTGLFMVAGGGILWLLRPFQQCEWYELGCHSANAFISPIFMIISGILLISGLIKLFGKKKK